MTQARLVRVFVLLAATGLALAFSALLFQSEKVSITAFVASLGVTVVFIDPYIGLLNYLMFLYVRPQDFIPGLLGLPVMLFLGSATLAFTVLHMALKKNSLGLSRVPLNYLMVWFLAAIAMSHLANLNLHEMSETVRGFLPTFLLYFIIVIIVTTEKRLQIFYYLLVIFSAFIAFQGIYQYFTGVGLAGQDLLGGRIRGIGIFSDPNDMAMALLVVLPFCFAEITSSRHIFLRGLSLALAGLIIVTIFISESRGGLLTFGLLTMFMFSRRFGWKIGVVIGVVAFAGIFLLGSSRMGTISTQEDSAYHRIEAWTIAIELVTSRPLFGVGARMFNDYFFLTAHNSFLLCAAELGLFGLVAWVLMLFISIKNLRFIGKHARSEKFGRLAVYADSLMLGMIAYVSSSMFLSRTYSEVLIILLGMSTSVMTMFVRWSDEKYVLMDKKDLGLGAAISVGTLIFFKGFLVWAW
jgi:putative inorganic carbon (HCO3(-)) transporter